MVLFLNCNIFRAKAAKLSWEHYFIFLHAGRPISNNLCIERQIQPIPKLSLLTTSSHTFLMMPSDRSESGQARSTHLTDATGHIAVLRPEHTVREGQRWPPPLWRETVRKQVNKWMRECGLSLMQLRRPRVEMDTKEGKGVSFWYRCQTTQDEEKPAMQCGGKSRAYTKSKGGFGKKEDIKSCWWPYQASKKKRQI